MAGTRYSSIKPLDFCYHPLKLLKDGEFIFVPCGKCDGCLLHKANEWSQRLSFEIDNNPFSIFFTLTYDNKYLPTLISRKSSMGDFVFYSDHSRNIRFNGSFDVNRNDNIIIRGNEFIPIQNDDRLFTVNYASKNDVQLWLKLVRKSISENLNYGKEAFRYYIISEIGPTTYRAHFHGILLPRSQEIAEYLFSTALYQNWKMCDRFLFFKHLHYCDGGTATYVSNYVAGTTSLPSIYTNPAIKPFRLSSRSPAIGCGTFNNEEVYEKVVERDLNYTRRISKIDKTYLLGYPSAYISRLFPKCYQFSLLSFRRLLWIYGYLYREVKGFGRPYFYVLQRLCKTWHSSDIEAMRRCYLFCQDQGATPFHYVFLLDRVWYLKSMTALSRWYSWQESNSAFPARIISSYNNFSEYVSNKHSLSRYQRLVIDTFCEQFGIVFDDLELSDLIFSDSLVDSYHEQVSDIVSNLDKSKRINELENQNLFSL